MEIMLSIKKNLINSIEEKVNFKIVSPNFNLNYNLSLKDIELKLDKLLRFSIKKMI